VVERLKKYKSLFLTKDFMAKRRRKAAKKATKRKAPRRRKAAKKTTKRKAARRRRK
jgi:hypothetical protein